MKVYKADVPENSVTKRYVPFHHCDTFECKFYSEKQIHPDDIQIAFWTKMPPWIETLFRIRNVLVKPFGLQTGKDGNLQQFKECIEKGGEHGLMLVTYKSPEETVICLDDKHLKAYLSVHIESDNHTYKVSTTTVVQCKYWLGFVYFYSILPFHYIIVKRMFKYTINRLR